MRKFKIHVFSAPQCCGNGFGGRKKRRNISDGAISFFRMNRHPQICFCGSVCVRETKRERERERERRYFYEPRRLDRSIYRLEHRQLSSRVIWREWETDNDEMI